MQKPSYIRPWGAVSVDPHLTGSFIGERKGRHLAFPYVEPTPSDVLLVRGPTGWSGLIFPEPDFTCSVTVGVVDTVDESLGVSVDLSDLEQGDEKKEGEAGKD
jgi:hypothetical protein